MRDQQQTDRPALRPAQMAAYPAGSTRLSPRWWLSDFDPGTTLLAREEHRVRRAAKPPKRSPDVAAQKRDRSYSRWLFQHEPASLQWISTVGH